MSNKIEAKLIHIQCGTFNGIANFQVGNSILRFELGTPNYNDYGEYRVDTEFEVIDFDEKYIGMIPTKGSTSIELTEDQVKWWMTQSEDMLLEYMKDQQVCGGHSKELGFVIFDKTNTILKYEDWEKSDHDPYEHFMFNVLSIFYYWLRSDEFNSTGTGLRIFPKL